MADMAYEKSLGNARFMKCIRARHKNGLVIAKVVMKPYPQLRLDEYVKVILGIHAAALIWPTDLNSRTKTSGSDPKCVGVSSRH